MAENLALVRRPKPENGNSRESAPKDIRNGPVFKVMIIVGELRDKACLTARIRTA